ncbi:ELO family [Aspergillus pseudotamarii]|uniref:Elongation of fatty acids protein n=1 Tax=Aspergillus pseudotamarii TaxID=132259 RepID=A0A5N6SPN4_ASPPS|nr:ELO family [Aspergillus pseudotamarii]KAE8136545.1 ELO family [Aspergillus pseudotamarii]
MGDSIFPMYFGLPDPHIFKLPPNSHPLPSLPASQSQLSWDRPINISPALFYHTLDVKLPLLIACLYAICVCTVNHLNRKRQNRPWPLSCNPLFHQFVLFHNVGLVLFSAWIALGTYQTIKSTLMLQRSNLPLVSALHALCKFDGKEEKGSLVQHTTSNDHSVDILHPGILEFDSLWDRGIDYYMWMFYMSKFYEVVDTVLLLMKGRNSSFLQTYHHAGVMLCTWAGVRYASPPGLVGLLLNSVIHTLMYFYYTLATLKVAVPGLLKRILTGMQIAQFILGSIFAWSYLFISFDATVWPPLTSTNKARDEIYGNESRTNIPFRQDNFGRVPCLDNSGQVFALLLTTIYLVPLTCLFLRFFVRSYLSGPNPKLVKD